MKLKNEFNPIRNWAEERSIYKKGDVKTQYIKLLEEVGELAKAILDNDEEEEIDAIGDIVVALTNLAKLKGYKIEDCINSAYEVIAKRRGKMINGTFVKDPQGDLFHKTTAAVMKDTVIAELHNNGYYNLPCSYRDINKFLETNNIVVGDVLFTDEDNLHIIAKPSKKEGGVAYVYLNDRR